MYKTFIEPIVSKANGEKAVVNYTSRVSDATLERTWKFTVHFEKSGSAMKDGLPSLVAARNLVFSSYVHDGAASAEEFRRAQMDETDRYTVEGCETGRYRSDRPNMEEMFRPGTLVVSPDGTPGWVVGPSERNGCTRVNWGDRISPYRTSLLKLRIAPLSVEELARLNKDNDHSGYHDDDEDTVDLTGELDS